MDLPLPDYGPNLKRYAANDRRRFWRALLASMAFVALIWWIKMVEMWLGADFASVAIRPREALGLIGIFTAPLLHGSVEHTLSNTLPLLVLGSLAGWIYPKSALRAVALIWIGSGIFVWLFGRPPAHLGASGLNHGLLFFVFVLGIIRRDRPAVAGAMIAFFLYGGMLMTTLPREVGVSWEAHLGGAIFGVIAAILWRNRDPAPPRKKYSWEIDPDSDALVEDRLLRAQREALEPARPEQVKPIWDGPHGTRRSRSDDSVESRGRVVRFPSRGGDDEGTPPTVH